jgi:hypothetical protein
MAISPRGLRCVVQVGFAGSRRLVEPAPTDLVAAAKLDDEIRTQLIEHLRDLPAKLGLGEEHFLCGISQVAVGADMHFGAACRELAIPQRIFLPQHREEYLNAVDSAGVPDFAEAERAAARQMLASDHLIQERVVSDAPGRRERFEDVNLEILHVSDVVVCLLRANAEGQKGGTLELLERAVTRGCPALEIRVDVRNGQATLKPTWHNLERFRPPAPPAELAHVPGPDGAGLPDADAFGDALTEFAGARAEGSQRWFSSSAVIIIVTHLLATICAALALAAHVAAPVLVLALLGVELIALAVGFGVHRYLHTSHTAGAWAMSRLAAEAARSAGAVGRSHVYLHHFFQLPTPDRLRPLLRTLSVLKLRSTRPHRDEPWEALRDEYVARRLDDERSGQIPYYTKALESERPRLESATRLFAVFSVLAIGATVFKLLILTGTTGEALSHEHWLTLALGVLAILLPVLAVGTLSLAAAMDYEARTHTFGEVLIFLSRQRELLRHAVTRREFEGLMLETEARLLGETANWYSRRSYLGV